MQNATQSNGTIKRRKTAHRSATLTLNANQSIIDHTKQSPIFNLHESSIIAQTQAKPNKTNANKTKVGKSNAGKRRTRGSQTNASFLQMPKVCWAPASFFFPPIAASG